MCRLYMDDGLAAAAVLEGIFDKGRKGERRDQKALERLWDVDPAFGRTGG